MRYKLLSHTTINDFSSATEIEFLNDQVFVFDEAVKDSLVLNKRWKKIKRLSMTGTELMGEDAGSGYPVKNEPVNAVIRAGSNADGQEKGYIIELEAGEVKHYDLSTFYNRINESNDGYPLKIQSTVQIKDQVVICNTPDENKIKNQLIITDSRFIVNQELSAITIIPVDLSDMVPESRLTSMAYSTKNDWLIFCAEKETNSDNFYSTTCLALIENASRKIGRKKIKINEFISFSDIHPLLNNQKAASICIQSEKTGRIKLLLLSKSENGVPNIFRIRIKE